MRKHTRSEALRATGTDPVREAILHAKTTGVSLGQVLSTEARRRKEVDENEQVYVVSMMVARRKVSGVILEFSTTSPGRRQTIELLLIGGKAFLQIPGSKRLTNQLRKLAIIL